MANFSKVDDPKRRMDGMNNMKKGVRDKVKGVGILKLLFGVLLLGVIMLLPLQSFAAMPQIITYQGKLISFEGSPLTGSYDMTFKIYDAATSGSELWTETHTGVTVNKGKFSVILGESTPIPPIFNGSDRWLGIAVGADPEMTPRMRLAATPYAYYAVTAESLSGSGFVQKTGDTMSGTLEIQWYDGSNTIEQLRLNNTDGGGKGSKIVFWYGASNLEVGRIANFYDGIAWSLRLGTYTVPEVLTLTSNNRAGILATNPQSTLDVGGNAVIGASYAGAYAAPSNGLLVEGNVGIGATSPGALLEVYGSNGSDLNALMLTNASWSADQLTTLGYYAGGGKKQIAAIKSKLYGGGADGELQFHTLASDVMSQKMVLKNNGNVGIGTDTTASLLTVNGTIEMSSGSAGGIKFPDGTLQETAATGGGGGGGWVDDGTVIRLDTSTDFVGIGTASPAQTLEVKGSIAMGDYSTNIKSRYVGAIDSSGDVKTGGMEIENTDVGGSYSQKLHLYTHHYGGTRGRRLSIDEDGKVGVGIESPTSIFTVNGTIEMSSGSAGGIKFPDGTLQESAATGGGGGGISTAEADTKYVNITGDTMTGLLSIEASLRVIGSAEIGNANNVASGPNSVAIGDGVVASGLNSFAAGYNSSATGDASTALGWNCYAYNEGAFAAGRGCTAYGLRSVAMVSNAIAMNDYSIAIGYFAKSVSEGVALGWSTTSNGLRSTALGSSTIADGQYTIVAGWASSAEGNFSVAMGSQATTWNHYSVSMGRDTAAWYNAVALGRETKAMGNYSTAIGWGTNAVGDDSFALGRGITVGTAASNGKYSFGIGLSEDSTMETITANNVMAIMNGNVGIGTTDPQAALHVVGNLKVTGTIEGASPVKIKGGVIFEGGIITGDASGLSNIAATSIADSAITGTKLATDINISTTGIVTTAAFSGSGILLTNINATNINNGTLPDARLTTNVVTLAATQTLTNKTIDGGSNTLSNIADSSLSTISTAGKVSGAAINAGIIGGSAGINTTGIVTASAFGGSGILLTNINATNINNGTLPDARLTTNIVTLAATQTLTNKTLTTPTIGDFTNASHNHSNAAGGGTLNASAIAAGQLAAARGGTALDTSGSTGFAKVSSGTWSVASITETKSATFLNPSTNAAAYIRLPYAATITSVEVYCENGTNVTGAVDNVTGTTVATVGPVSAGTWLVASSVSNTGYTANNTLKFYLTAVTGAVTSATVKVNYTRTQ